MKIITFYLLILLAAYSQIHIKEKEIKISNKPISAIIISPNNKYIAVYSYENKNIEIYNTENAELVKNIFLQIKNSLVFNFSEDSRYLFYGDRNSSTKYNIYDLIYDKTITLNFTNKYISSAVFNSLDNIYFIEQNSRKYKLSEYNVSNNKFTDLSNDISDYSNVSLKYINGSKLGLLVEKNSKCTLEEFDIKTNNFETKIELYKYNFVASPFVDISRVNKELLSISLNNKALNKRYFLLYNFHKNTIIKEFDFNFSTGPMYLTEDFIVSYKYAGRNNYYKLTKNNINNLTKEDVLGDFYIESIFNSLLVYDNYAYVLPTYGGIQKFNLYNNQNEIFVDITIDTNINKIRIQDVKYLNKKEFQAILSNYFKFYNKKEKTFTLTAEQQIKLYNLIVNNYDKIDANWSKNYKDELRYIIKYTNMNPLRRKYFEPYLYVNSEYHTSPISTIRFSNDGKELITASWDKTIKIWDSQTGRLKRTIHTPFGEGIEGMIYAMDISKDNKYIAIGGYSAGTTNKGKYSGDFVTLIDYQTGEILDVETAHSQAIFSIAFSDDGKLLASGGGDGDNNVAVYNIINGKIKNRIRFNLESGMVRGIKFLPNSRDLVAVTSGGLLFQIRPAIFDDNGNLLEESQMAMIGASPGKMLNIQKAKALNGVVIADNGENAITIAEIPQFHKLKKSDEELTMIGNDLKPSKSIYSRRIGDARSIAISNNGKYLAYANDTNIVLIDLSIKDSVSQKLLKYSGKVLTLAFSPDNQHLAVAGTEPYDIYIYSLKDFSIYKVISSKSDLAIKNLGVSTSSKTTLVWDRVINNQKYTFAFDLKNFTFYSNYQDDRIVHFEKAYKFYPQDITTGSPLIFTQIDDFDVVGYRYAVKAVHNNDVLLSYSNKGIPVTGIAKLQQENLLAIAYENGTIDFYRTGTGDFLGTLFISSENQYLYIHSSGYYTGNVSTLSQIGWKLNIWDYYKLLDYWKKDLEKGSANKTLDDKFKFIKEETYKNKFIKFIPFEQFDIILNRPDIVTGTFFTQDENENLLLKMAYEKRLKKLPNILTNINLDSIPKVTILNPQNSTNNKQFQLTFSSDNSFNYYQIWIDGNPIYPYPGNKNTKNLNQITENIILSNGLNNIQVSVINENGESLRESFEILYTPSQNIKTKNQKQKIPASSKAPQTYLLTIAFSNFDNNEYNLTYPIKDANDIISFFKSRYQKNLQVLSFHNKAFTNVEYVKAQKFISAADVDDNVIIYIASHGLIDFEQLEYYIATSKTNFNNISQNSIKFDDIENLLTNCKSRNKIIFVDACHSGEIDKDLLNNNILSSLPKNVNSRGLKIKPAKNTQNIIIDYNKINKYINELFVDIRKNNGSIIIASSSAQEFSFEDDKYKNGLFTYTLLDGLRNKTADFNQDGTISIKELKNYIRLTVPKITNNLQNPNIRSDNIYNKLSF